jgi:hypothetical protein
VRCIYVIKITWDANPRKTFLKNLSNNFCCKAFHETRYLVPLIFTGTEKSKAKTLKKESVTQRAGIRNPRSQNPESRKPNSGFSYFQNKGLPPVSSLTEFFKNSHLHLHSESSAKIEP